MKKVITPKGILFSFSSFFLWFETSVDLESLSVEKVLWGEKFFTKFLKI